MVNYDLKVGEKIGSAIRNAPYLKSNPEKLANFLTERFGLIKRDAVQIALRLANEPELADFPPIEKMELILTLGCNLRCDYCFVDKHSGMTMNEENGKKAIDFLLDSSADVESVYITFFGGEPLLAFDLMKELVLYGESAERSKKKKINWRMTTNGTLFNKKILEFLNKHEIFYLLSVDGKEETHDRYRLTKTGKGSFNFLADKFEMMKVYQSWMGARVTVMPDTVHFLLENIKFLVQNGINLFIIEPVEGISWPEESENMFIEQMTEVAKFYIEKRNDFNLKISFFDKILCDKKDLTYVRGCWAGKSSIAVSPDGKIFPCSKFISPESLYPPFILGDIERGITEKMRRQQLFQFPYRSECYECEVAFECSGGCPARNYNASGTQSYTCFEECERARMKGRLSRSIKKKLSLLC